MLETWWGRLNERVRGVSSLVSTVLLIGIAVLVAGMLLAMVFSVFSGQESSSIAAVDVETVEDEGVAKVQVISLNEVEHVVVEANGAEYELESVGETVEIDGAPETLVVYGVRGSNGAVSEVVQTFELEFDSE